MLKYDTSNPQYVLHAKSKNAENIQLASMILTNIYNSEVYKVEFIITKNFSKLSASDKSILSNDIISFIEEAQLMGTLK